MQYSDPRDNEREIETPPDDQRDDRHQDDTTPDSKAREKPGTHDYKYTDWASI